jgi:hypothetical protein
LFVEQEVLIMENGSWDDMSLLTFTCQDCLNYSCPRQEDITKYMIYLCGDIEKATGLQLNMLTVALDCPDRPPQGDEF